jgi:hypothetical protein
LNAVSVSDDILKYLKKSYEIPEEEKSLKNVKKSSTSALENVIFCSSGSHCAADANDLFEHFQSDENSSSILFNILIISQYIVCYEKMKSEKRKTLCPFYMKLLLEVFSSKQTSAAEGSILILAARKVKVAFSDNVWQKSQNPEQQQPSLFVRKKTGGRN